MRINSHNSKTLIVFSMMFVLVTAAWICADEPTQHAKRRVTVIKSGDIGVGAKIHGKLGLPLGDLTTVQGQCVKTENQKEYGDRSTFRIERLDGVALAHPVELVVDSFGHRGTANPLKVGKAYELRGYEHGQFHGVPSDAYEEYVRAGNPHFATVTGYPFRTEFVYLSARKL